MLVAVAGLVNTTCGEQQATTCRAQPRQVDELTDRHGVSFAMPQAEQWLLTLFINTTMTTLQQCKLQSTNHGAHRIKVVAF